MGGNIISGYQQSMIVTPVNVDDSNASQVDVHVLLNGVSVHCDT